MRRYTPLLLVAFFLLITAVIGSSYLSSYAGKQAPVGITVYTTLPLEQLSVLSQEFEKTHHIQVSLVPIAAAELAAHLKTQSLSPAADVIITSQDVLCQAGTSQTLAAYATEQTDIIPQRFKDDGNTWVGLWYDPLVFAINNDVLIQRTKAPSHWADLAEGYKYRIGITDFLAADAAANLLFTLVAVNGEVNTLAYLKKLHPRVVQYSKFLATPVRMVGMGEVDVAIAPQSEALRYIHNKFPISIIYPEDGTAFLLTAGGIVAGTQHMGEAKQFIDWLLQDEAQQALARNNFHLVPVNPENIIYQSYSTKNIKLFELKDNVSLDQRNQLLDKWVKTVRLAAN